MNEYLKEHDLWSTEELVLLDYFKFRDLSLCISIDVSSLYRMMVDKAFLSGYENNFTRALRVAYQSFVNCKPYRMTEEFNSAIRKELNSDSD